MNAISFQTSMTFDYGVPQTLVPGVARVVANNPGFLTFKGTNTYLVGETSLAVIDPGPEDAAHRAAILAAAGGRAITHIISTHAHRDHVDGIAALKAETGALVCAFKRTRADVIPLERTPQGREFIDLELDPDIVLHDGARIAGEGWALTTVHTPGHAPDHLCFAHEETGALFSGDHVMAWNTTVVAPPEGNMADYISSLEKLLARDSDRVYLPGHGGRIDEPRRTVKAYLVHRKVREQAILKAIQDGATSIRALIPVIYPDLSPKLSPAAQLTLLAHVEWLTAKGLVSAAGPLTADQLLEAV
jgi:glyoxylase-like metal-dependent hydrolase (beta-lactamase superfamily II)